MTDPPKPHSTTITSLYIGGNDWPGDINNGQPIKDAMVASCGADPQSFSWSDARSLGDRWTGIIAAANPAKGCLEAAVKLATGEDVGCSVDDMGSPGGGFKE